ncbi:MAG: T9SS type B sorting domain-containing protein, partial [Flavobacterium sp.]|uniref:T9SS type B sorting domain-containing protein n=1 Tax=Flavobacterium sp. TaxID=239 RepID=UPI00262D67E8
TSYDSFQWYKNDTEITGATNSEYTPTEPGYYQVRGSISGCLSNVFSDKIPVSSCPTDIDNDNICDNIDIDNDNDGITNCTESYGNQNIDISNLNAGNVAVDNYSNSFTGMVSTSTNASLIPFTGSADGSFISEVPAGKENSVTYTLNFLQPMSVGIEYVPIANPTDLINADAEYIVNSDIDKTITVINPDNQLLIDTNYDGIYESGITEFSSFEIRFRLNSSIPLAAGSGTFKLLTYLSNSIRFTHKNLSDDNANKSTLKFFATCVPKDSDSDGIADQLDSDSDNDGIPDTIEAQANSTVTLSNIDSNKDGLDNNFEPGFSPIDTDNDGIFDYLDLDSDNDGILDSVETGIDTDADGIRNYRDLDSDNDLCSDVVEAGFLDPNSDGFLGDNPIVVDANGIVTSGIGYSSPNNNYLISALIVITTQPNAIPTCELENTTISVADNGGNTYQWQLFTGGNWTDIVDNTTYSGTTTNTLAITTLTNAMNGNQYRVQLNKVGNSCGLLSAETTLVVHTLPVVNDITIIQCDDNLDAITSFNLTVKNDVISTNSANETFTYYTSLAGANTENPAELISNPLAFVNTTPSTMPVWSRIENTNGCFSVAEITLQVLATQIPSTFKIQIPPVCDDYLDAINDDRDGISNFDFSSVSNDILNLLPSGNYSITYYRNQADALAELNVIPDISNYRNIGYPNSQQIWVRVDSDIDNSCYGLGPFVELKVEVLPNINLNSNGSEDEYVCTNLPNLFVKLNAGIQDGTSEDNYTYVWTKDGIVIPNTSPTLDTNSAGIYTVEVFNSSGCSRIRTIKVNPSDEAHIENIAIIDLTDVNTVTINVTGTGAYVYNLDDRNGYYQESNFFDDVSAGIHDVFIKDKNGCGIIPTKIAVIGVPKFFTPNNDGYNDYWNIKGVNANFNENSIIYIFDRYGKLLKQLSPSSQGWDGNFNGKYLPADDYWYTVKLEDGREAKGHFTLKR